MARNLRFSVHTSPESLLTMHAFDSSAAPPAAAMNDLAPPDGIEGEHVSSAWGAGLNARPLSLVALGLLLAAALLGVFGTAQRVSSASDGVRLTVEGPKRIRSGEFFEMLITVETERAVRDAVLRVDADVWREVTINTMIPAAAEEAFKDGAFEFHFGPLEPSSRLLFKVDGQINPAYPPVHNVGAVAFADTRATFVTVTYSMRVLP